MGLREEVFVESILMSRDGDMKMSKITGNNRRTQNTFGESMRSLGSNDMMITYNKIQYASIYIKFATFLAQVTPLKQIIYKNS